MTPIEREALEAYVERLRAHYGGKLHDVVVFGSRARGDHGPESDVDLAILLKDGDWNFWSEKLVVADLSYEALMDVGLVVQGWPISLAAWQAPAGHAQSKLIEAMKRDARAWRDAA